MIDLNRLRNLDALKISLASSDEILNWSYGEVTKPETINYRTFKPEKDGLFCEKIFGPVKDYECACGKYKRVRFKGVVCDRCGVQVTTSKVRRERMGHIHLSSPVAHVWFFKNIPSVMAAVLGLPPRSLELVIYFSSFIVTEIDFDAKKELNKSFPDRIIKAREEAKIQLDADAKALLTEAEDKIKSLSKQTESKWDEKLKTKAEEIRAKAKSKSKDLLSQEQTIVERAELEVRKIEKKLQEVELYTVMTDKEVIHLEEYLDEFCEVSIGAEAMQKILAKVDVKKLSEELHADLEDAKSTKADKIRKRLKVVDNFLKGGVDPKSMIVDTLPVIPPDLRPMVQLEGGRFATSDLNDLYRRIINRNNRLRRLLELGAPDIIVRNEKRMLQEAVDALFDSSKVRKTRTRDRKTYRSIADAIKGKQGHFRANLLGKRVDYSGRAVIVSGPHLKMNECGLPTEMALELFRPFLIREIMSRGLAPNMKTAKYILEEKTPEVYSILEGLVAKRPVLLNRAPTLHRLSIQAFYPKLTDNKAIQLHPVVCSGFNADFDGDQMAVHLPLSDEAVEEAIELMLSTNNLLKPADGSVVTIPSHEMVLGLYYFTSIDERIAMPKTVFSDFQEMHRAYGSNVIKLRQLVKVMDKDGHLIETSIGRVIFNRSVPKEIGYVNYPLSKSKVKDLIKQTMEKSGIEATIELIDDMKMAGFKYSTKSGISLSIFDCVRPTDIDEVRAKADEEISQIEQNLHMGFITESEMETLSLKVWGEFINHFDNTILSHMDKENPVSIVISAGAGKASPVQMRQISAIKGLIADPKGKIINIPVLGNYSNGLSSFDYFLTGRGTRKSYMDKGLGTADAGYLTRRLVNVAQDVLVRQDDCGATQGRTIVKGEDTPLTPWHKRGIGRYTLNDIKAGNKVIVKKGELITKEAADLMLDLDVSEYTIRSPFHCATYHGVCAKCYGINLSENEVVKNGVAVGIIAAQSIGEPGTQLTMNVFHKGGIAAQNITQGLPRVEEIFEVRKPKRKAIISSLSGKVRFEKDDGNNTIVVESTGKDKLVETYTLDAMDEVIVAEGDLVAPGSKLTIGSMNLQDV
ncbi:MAG: DNA-directed polymerase subunit beta, partial [Patescibacteria group bacterium]|nr:DNA-directed polymerase subunit beta [Patescibacteria group bacterium]